MALAQPCPASSWLGGAPLATRARHTLQPGPVRLIAFVVSSRPTTSATGHRSSIIIIVIDYRSDVSTSSACRPQMPTSRAGIEPHACPGPGLLTPEKRAVLLSCCRTGACLLARNHWNWIWSGPWCTRDIVRRTDERLAAREAGRAGAAATDTGAGSFPRASIIVRHHRSAVPRTGHGGGAHHRSHRLHYQSAVQDSGQGRDPTARPSPSAVVCVLGLLREPARQGDQRW